MVGSVGLGGQADGLGQGLPGCGGYRGLSWAGTWGQGKGKGGWAGGRRHVVLGLPHPPWASQLAGGWQAGRAPGTQVALGRKKLLQTVSPRFPAREQAATAPSQVSHPSSPPCPMVAPMVAPKVAPARVSWGESVAGPGSNMFPPLGTAASF